MNLKRTALALLFFMCFCGYTGADGDSDTDNTNNYDGRWAVHVTWEIVHGIQNLIRNSGVTMENLHNLDLRLSKPVMITPIPYDDSIRLVGVDEDGVLERGRYNQSPASEINIAEKGTLRTIDPDIIVVLFKEGDIALKFRRNSQGRYDLFSAELGAETTYLHYDGRPPQLLVIDRPPEFNNRLDIQAVPHSSTGVIVHHTYDQHSQGYPDGGQSYRDGDRHSSERQNIGINNPAYQFAPSRNISDHGCLTPQGIAEYVRRQNSSVNQRTLTSLIETYIHEAGIEGVNHDIAIAQMLYATNNLNNQRMTSNNYGGLSSASGGDVSFRDTTEGVRAHIQHLKGYSSRQPPITPIVDPRYNILARLGYLGTVRTFDDLYRQWSVNPNYGSSIERILQGLYQYSANNR